MIKTYQENWSREDRMTYLDTFLIVGEIRDVVFLQNQLGFSEEGIDRDYRAFRYNLERIDIIGQRKTPLDSAKSLLEWGENPYDNYDDGGD